MHFNSRHDFIETLVEGPPVKEPITIEQIWDKKRPRKPRNPPTRKSHLKARQRFPTHPLVKIAKVLPAKLPTMAELEAMDHETLAKVFMAHCAKMRAKVK